VWCQHGAGVVTNSDHDLDPIDIAVWRAVLKVRRDHNAAQARLGLPITDHRQRSPWEQEGMEP